MTYEIEKQIEAFLDLVTLKVKQKRKEYKISQLELSQILGHKSPNYIAKIETRKANYNLAHIYQIAHALDIDPREMMPSTEEVYRYIQSGHLS